MSQRPKSAPIFFFFLFFALSLFVLVLTRGLYLFRFKVFANINSVTIPGKHNKYTIINQINSCLIYFFSPFATYRSLRFPTVSARTALFHFPEGFGERNTRLIRR